ncbi:hypothetical protein F5146DRAFT_160227 [Armillaria mellea]|nr:hypothetical protein F5146DRAFT_160227 [Armillaria mellea]
MKKAFSGCCFDRTATSISFIAALDSLSSYVPTSSTLAPQAIHSAADIEPWNTIRMNHSFRFGSKYPSPRGNDIHALYSRRPMDRQWVSDLDVPSSNPAKNPWSTCAQSGYSSCPKPCRNLAVSCVVLSKHLWLAGTTNSDICKEPQLISYLTRTKSGPPQLTSLIHELKKDESIWVFDAHHRHQHQLMITNRLSSHFRGGSLRQLPCFDLSRTAHGNRIPLVH